MGILSSCRHMAFVRRNIQTTLGHPRLDQFTCSSRSHDIVTKSAPLMNNFVSNRRICSQARLDFGRWRPCPRGAGPVVAGRRPLLRGASARSGWAMFRWGVIGSGFAARKFVPDFASRETQRRVLVYSRQEQNARRVRPRISASRGRNRFRPGGPRRCRRLLRRDAAVRHRGQALACLAAASPS